MITLINNCNNPYFNLALEEYLLNSELDEICYLWINEPSVIIGTNQNVYNEVNIEYTQSHNIHIARRLSGGGAVYHDLGNINYTFIKKQTEEGINFAKFTSPIISAINKMGVYSHLSGRNDIMIGDYKVSGSAQTVKNGKVLHHGCLLFDTDLTMVANTLKPSTDKLKSKGIKSVSSRVSNIKELTQSVLTPIQFKEYLSESIIKDSDFYSFTKKDVDEIKRLSDEKFSTWEWNFGKSKEFSNKVNKRFDFGSIEISYKLNKGVIEQIKFMGDFFSSKDISELEEKFTGVKYIKEDVEKVINMYNISDYIFDSKTEDILNLLFDI